MKALIEELTRRRRYGDAIGEAARWGEMDTVKRLLEAGVAVDTRGDNACTALMLASSAGNVRIARFLVEKGADTNAKDANGCKTPLQWCLAADHPEDVYLEIAKLLIGAGADPQAVSADGRTAIEMARARGCWRVVRLLEGKSGRQEPRDQKDE